VNSLSQRFREQGIQAQSFFEPDDSILHLQRIRTHLEHDDKKHGGKDHNPDPKKELGVKAHYEQDYAYHQIGEQGESCDQVIRWIKPGMVTEALWL
jgi:hypothetical protein